MARPQKEGLDYFPLDVDIDQDDKVALIEAQHGLEGFGIVVKLMMKIYKNSYYYSWTERERLLFSKVVNVDINVINDVVNDCIKWDLFSKDIYEKYNILTSKGIQIRYLEATSRRQETKIKNEYLLLSETQVMEYKNLFLEGINVDINSAKEGENANINPQSKVKESKVKKIKEKNSRKKIYDATSTHFKLAERLYNQILKNNPNHKKPDLQKWADDIRLTMERDKRTEEQIIYVIDWCQKDSFWKANILSVSKLREKFDQLVIQIQAKRKQLPKKPIYPKEDPKNEGSVRKRDEGDGNVQLFK
ncbi:DUF4373 domain-containing protein [Sutcliffiella halmapala]|uniref:DUF4373 domain-containing protein n=1 Tax=Sutcliffiella halmapala TaxID=79882 RepID=UPI000994A988|nr:DUF4373 domain-containing protein [Sutcliffiella halmapala]